MQSPGSRSSDTNALAAEELLTRLKSTLERDGKDYEFWIREFGQIDSSERRARGGSFCLRDHVRGLLLSQLSAQRPWGPIARNLDAIGRVFHGYDPDALREADAGKLTAEILDLRCGNRQVAGQIRSLRENIDTLRRIESEHGSLDTFVTSQPTDEVARLISTPGRYKLRYVGFTLAIEYLRNVGIRAGKPDVHIRRILGHERLGFSDEHPAETEAFALVERLAAEAGCNPTYLDNLLWIFCAQDYGDVCGARPRCGVCDLRLACRSPAC